MFNVSFGIQREIDIPEVITSRPAGVQWITRVGSADSLFSFRVFVINLISIYITGIINLRIRMDRKYSCKIPLYTFGSM